MVPDTVRKILERQEPVSDPSYMTLEQLADVDPRSYIECTVRVPVYTGKCDTMTLMPQQAYDLARMNRLLRGHETCAVSREEFGDLSARLAGCPRELVRRGVGGNLTPSATARAAEYLIKK